jgi:fructose-specific phosphotransferase system IIC component
VRSPEPEPEGSSRTVRTVKGARRPRFLPFILTGVVVGFAVGGALAVFGWLEDPDPTIASNYSPTSSVGYLGFLGALLFGLLAAVIAVLLERRSDRS